MTDTFAERLRREREGHGYSRRQLAEKAGISLRAIDEYELYGVIPTLYYAALLSNALDVSLDYLAGGYYENRRDIDLFFCKR